MGENSTPRTEAERVTRFRLRADKAELARLNRLTGLAFEAVPVSLLRPDALPAGDAETVAEIRAEPASRPARS